MEFIYKQDIVKDVIQATQTRNQVLAFLQIQNKYSLHYKYVEKYIEYCVSSGYIKNNNIGYEFTLKGKILT